MKKGNKNKILIIGGIILVIVLGVISFWFFKTNNKDSIKFKKEYESLNGVVREKDKQTIRTINIDDDNPFIYQSSKDIVERINRKETFAVYFGFADCPWCRSVIPTMVNVAKDLNVGEIYYVDVKDIRNVLEVNDDGEVVTVYQGDEGYGNLLNSLGNVLEDYTLKDKDGEEVETGMKRIYAPSLVVVKRGVALGMTSGVSEKETNAYMELSEEMKHESYESFKNILQKLSDEGGVCGPQTGC